MGAAGIGAEAHASARGRKGEKRAGL